MQIIHAPNEVLESDTTTKVFLAGTIDMGNSKNWQAEFAAQLKDVEVTLFNPRRLDWDSSWKQDPNAEPFRSQVLWEHHHINSADLVVFNFEPGSQSPITLLELGMKLGRPVYKNVLVRCPKAYFRYGNVALMCELCGIRVCETLEELVERARHTIAEMETSFELGM